jgi:UDP-glucose 6-dehydrogenase
MRVAIIGQGYVGLTIAVDAAALLATKLLALMLILH